MARQSSSSLSTLASKILAGEKKPTLADAKKLAASVLSQDETKGQKPPEQKGQKPPAKKATKKKVAKKKKSR